MDHFNTPTILKITRIIGFFSGVGMFQGTKFFRCTISRTRLNEAALTPAKVRQSTVPRRSDGAEANCNTQPKDTWTVFRSAVLFHLGTGKEKDRLAPCLEMWVPAGKMTGKQAGKSS